MRHPAASSDEDREATLAGAQHRHRGVRHRPASAGPQLAARRGRPARPARRRDAARPRPDRRARSDRQKLDYPGAGIEHTIWAKGMRVVRDVTGTPIRPGRHGDRRPGQRRARGHLRRRRGRRAARGRRPPDQQVQGRGGHRPDGARRHHPRPRAGRTGRSTASSATRRSAPTSAARSPCTSGPTHHLLCPCHQSTFDLADTAKVVFGPAARALPQLPLAVDDEGYLVATERLRRTCRTELLGAWLIMDTSKVANSNTDDRGDGQEAEPHRRRRRTGPTSASASRRWARSSSARSSPTTGRSCSARSRCGASSSCS